MNGNSPENLLAALFRAQDILDRAIIPFIVLGEVSYQIKNNQPLEANKISIGILKRHATESGTSLLSTIDPAIEQLTDGWRLVHNEVPVTIKIIEKEHPVLRNPDIVFYKYDTFCIPNPFEKYWKGNHFDV